jgi:hypothetical protein
VRVGDQLEVREVPDTANGAASGTT